MQVSCGGYYPLYFKITNGITDLKITLIEEVYPKSKRSKLSNAIGELPILGLLLDLKEFFTAKEILCTESFAWSTMQIVFKSEEACVNTYREFINEASAVNVVCVQNVIAAYSIENQLKLVRRFFGSEFCNSPYLMGELQAGLTESKIDNLIKRHRASIHKNLGDDMSALLLILNS